jgi:hypothetical protein
MFGARPPKELAQQVRAIRKPRTDHHTLRSKIIKIRAIESTAAG